MPIVFTTGARAADAVLRCWGRPCDHATLMWCVWQWGCSGFFRCVFTAFFGLLFGVEALPIHPEVYTLAHMSLSNNNNNTIWGGSVLTGEEPPPHSGELKHALAQAGGPTQSQLSRPMSSGHHISMEHRLRRKQLNSDTNACNKTYLKETQEKEKKKLFSFEKNEK